MLDIFLYAPAASPTDIILSHGLREIVVVPAGTGIPTLGWFGGGRKRRIRVPVGAPPVAVSLHDALTERYGTRKGKEVWSHMVAERAGPFAPGAKYDPDKARVERRIRNAGLGELLE